MQLRFGDTSGEVEVDDRGTIVSPHTGRTLEQLDVDIDAVGDGVAAIESVLKSKPPLATDVETGKQYTVRMRSKSSYGDSHTWTYDLELTEYEVIEVTALQIGDLTIKPYHYEERVDDDVITITARVQLDSDAVEQLEDLITTEPRPYFPVVRHGLQDEPRPMRFGACYWSKQAEGRKYSLVLVDQAWDDDPRRQVHIFDPEIPRMMEAIASLQTTVECLVQRLEDTASLSAEEAAELRSQLHSVPTRRQLRQFHRCQDVDDY